MRELTAAFVLALCFVFASAAYACDKKGSLECPIWSGTTTGKFTDIEGGYSVNLEATGPEDSIKTYADELAGKIKARQEGTCDCKGKRRPKCPWDVKGLDVSVARAATGLTVSVKGKAEALKEFKARWDAILAGRCDCKGYDCDCWREKMEDEERRRGCPHKHECPKKKDGKCQHLF